MPSFSVDISFPIGMVYNPKAKGGLKLEGAADVEVVHNKKKQQERVDHDDFMQYVKYALNRVENS